ncbi:hypothetical protein [Falsigemmobacter faecalis]|uniref:Uncharacterized protein n=1 Tax=Falsigemmobacter faecalis TaxID=2488730 RepID=A0A3P3DJT9_9RHOB|nr:hypothetical protein [Falsigemmobacter faecalis]RRH73976.1 hypothetical protein EG244_11870 [Falsigemmobacter faecalis]
MRRGDLPPVKTFYRENISRELLEAQRMVFAHLGIELQQELEKGMKHADWLDRSFGGTSDEVVVVCDIDAFPLNTAAFAAMVGRARSGVLTGLEQVANHVTNRAPYAGPMFLAAPAGLWQRLGRPASRATEAVDVAQAFTVAARAAGSGVEVIAPRFAIAPKWALGDRGVFGIGTFYGDLDFFHLFEARLQSPVELFCAVAEGVVSGRHDFARYLEIMREVPPVVARPRKRFGLF